MDCIESQENRWVKLARRIKEKKYRDRTGKFLMEGIRSVEDASTQGYRDGICFLTEEALGNPRVQALLLSAKAQHWLFLKASPSVMKLLTGTEHGQGVVAILNQKKPNWENVLQPLHGHYVLLDGVQDPGNLGSILRTAAAAGAKGIFLMKGCADPYGEKVVRSSMGSILRIPVYQDLSIEQIQAMRRESRLPFIGTALKGGMPYRLVERITDGVFVFGNEGNGIRPELLEICDTKLYIPMAGNVESLNVAASAAVLLFYFMEYDRMNG